MYSTQPVAWDLLTSYCHYELLPYSPNSQLCNRRVYDDYTKDLVVRPMLFMREMKCKHKVNYNPFMQNFLL